MVMFHSYLNLPEGNVIIWKIHVQQDCLVEAAFFFFSHVVSSELRELALHPSILGTCNFSVNLNSVGKDTWVEEMVQTVQADSIH